MKNMPIVSVIIPTHNRPELLKKALASVLAQTYRDFEIIVVDDGTKQRAGGGVGGLNDPRIKYIQHEKEKGGSAARNTGIRNSVGKFIAFLDDDDEWLSHKLEVQMNSFTYTESDVGFCFSGVVNLKNDKEFATAVPEGVADYYRLAVASFKSFLTVTLIIKDYVFNEAGNFDEELPSHQEAELMLRISKKFRGLGINQPLARVNMSDGHEQVGKDIAKSIAGRKLVLQKHLAEFKKYPDNLARHYFDLGLFYRDNRQYDEAGIHFKKALTTNFKFRYLLHFFSMMFNGNIYKHVRN